MTSGGEVFDFLTVAEVRALVTTPLTDEQLADVMQREGAWLARQIGPLDGERTQVFQVADADLDKPLWLRRPTDGTGDEFVVSDNGTDLDATQIRLLRNGTGIERVDASWTGPEVSVTYVPNDDDEVARVLIELVRYGVSETGYASERIGDYSYQRASGGSGMARNALVRSLLPTRGPGTARLRSTMIGERVGEIR